MKTIVLVAWVAFTYYTLEVNLRELRPSLYRRAYPITSTPSLSQLATFNINATIVSGPSHTSTNIYVT